MHNSTKLILHKHRPLPHFDFVPGPYFGRQFSVQDVNVNVRDNIGVNRVNLVHGQRHLKRRLYASGSPGLKAVRAIVQGHLLADRVGHVVGTNSRNHPQHAVRQVVKGRGIIAIKRQAMLRAGQFPNLATRGRQVESNRLLRVLRIFDAVPERATIRPSNTDTAFLITNLDPGGVRQRDL